MLISQYINCFFCLRFQNSASPEHFRRTHHALGFFYKEGIVMSNIMSLKNNFFTILTSKANTSNLLYIQALRSCS